MRTPRKGIWLLMRNSSAQDFAFTAKSVKTCKFSQKNLPLAEGDLKWADSVTGKPKAELLQRTRFNGQFTGINRTKVKLSPGRKRNESSLTVNFIFLFCGVNQGK
jgi:hypothetical protein